MISINKSVKKLQITMMVVVVMKRMKRKKK